jgi:hypothetical protein
VPSTVINVQNAPLCFLQQKIGSLFSKILSHNLAIHPSFGINSIQDTRSFILDFTDGISTGGLEVYEAWHDDTGISTGKSDEKSRTHSTADNICILIIGVTDSRETASVVHIDLEMSFIAVFDTRSIKQAVVKLSLRITKIPGNRTMYPSFRDSAYLFRSNCEP